MLLDLPLILELALLGVVTGFLAGLLGIGGGMMMVPFITLLMGSRGVAGKIPPDSTLSFVIELLEVKH